MNVPGWTYFHGLYAVHQKMIHSTSPPCNGTVSTCRIHWPVLGHWHLSNLCVFSQWTLRFPHEKLTQFTWPSSNKHLHAASLSCASGLLWSLFFEMLTTVPYEQVHTVVTLWLCSEKGSVNVILLMLCNYTYRGGFTLSVCLSVHLSVCLCVNLLCSPCTIYSSGWILSIFGTNDQ